jgi:O-antigen/teichoic acid export membrane protein
VISEAGGSAQPETLSSIRRRVSLGAVWGTGTWLLVFVLGYPTSVLLVRSLSHTQYGFYAVAGAIAAFGMTIGGFGLSPATSFLASKLREEQGDQGIFAAMRAAFRLSAIGGALAGAIGGSIVLILHSLPAWHSVAAPFAVLLPTLLLAPLGAAMVGMLQALFRPAFISVASSLQSIVRVALVVFLVLYVSHPSAMAAAATQTVGSLVSYAVLAVGVRTWRARHPVVPVLSVPLARLARFGAAMVLSSAAWTAISQLDVFVLGLNRGPATTGLYAPVSQLASIIIGLPALFGAYLLPSMSSLVAAGRTEEVAQTYHWASRWSIAMSAGPLAAFIVSPGAVLTVVYGPGYARLAEPATILGLGAACSIMVGYNILTLSAHGLASLTTVASLCGLVVSGILCIVLIPWTGTVGAAIATSGAILVVNAMTSILLATRCGIKPFDRMHALTALAFTASLGVSWAVTQGLSGTPAILVCAAVALTSFLITTVPSLTIGQERRAIAQLLQNNLRKLAVGKGTSRT